MKKVLAVFLSLILFWTVGMLWFSLALRDRDFARRSQAAAGAIFLTHKGARRFICSGTTIGHFANGDAMFLTARHCVYEDAEPPSFESDGHPAGLLGDEEVSFSANEAGPFYTAVPFKVSATDDVALLRLVNGAGLSSVRLGTEYILRSGDPLTNYTFALNLGRMPITLRVVTPTFAHLPDDLLEQIPTWKHSMPVDGTVAPGSSGSGLFDPRQHALVGVAVGSSGNGGLNIAIPVSRVWNLLADPHPQDLTPVITPKSASPDGVETTEDGL